MRCRSTWNIPVGNIFTVFLKMSFYKSAFGRDSIVCLLSIIGHSYKSEFTSSKIEDCDERDEKVCEFDSCWVATARVASSSSFLDSEVENRERGDCRGNSEATKIWLLLRISLESLATIWPGTFPSTIHPRWVFTNVGEREPLVWPREWVKSNRNRHQWDFRRLVKLIICQRLRDTVRNFEFIKLEFSLR